MKMMKARNVLVVVEYQVLMWQVDTLVEGLAAGEEAGWNDQVEEKPSNETQQRGRLSTVRKEGSLKGST